MRRQEARRRGLPCGLTTGRRWSVGGRKTRRRRRRRPGVCVERLLVVELFAGIIDTSKRRKLSLLLRRSRRGEGGSSATQGRALKSEVSALTFFCLCRSGSAPVVPSPRCLITHCKRKEGKGRTVRLLCVSNGRLQSGQRLPDSQC